VLSNSAASVGEKVFSDLLVMAKVADARSVPLQNLVSDWLPLNLPAPGAFVLTSSPASMIVMPTRELFRRDHLSAKRCRQSHTVSPASIILRVILSHSYPVHRRVEPIAHRPVRGFGSGAYSAKLLNGTKQRFSGWSQARQCGDDVLLMLVTGGPARGGGGMPHRIIIISR
jgi:hypothetical protein